MKKDIYISEGLWLLSIGFIIFFLISSFLTTKAVGQTNTDFITVKNSQFLKNGEPYYYLGTNFWAAMNLGIANNSDYQARLIRELDQLQSLGINNLRIMAASEGPDTEPWRMVPALQPALGEYNEDLLKGLDFLLVEMAKRDMVGVLCLNNMWPWSGGFAQYVNWVTGETIPYPPPADGGKWLKYMNFSARFFKNKAAQAAYFKHLEVIINRTNSISTIPYKADPTIMAWQLANEPRAIVSNRKYRKWIKNTAAFIKSLDANHLVSIGSEGNAFVPFATKFKKEHRIKNIDYATMHIWIQNWGWYDPTKPEKTYEKALNKAKNYIRKHITLAQKLNMPVVLEEFGIARDMENYEPSSPTTYRDNYYYEIFDLIHQAAANRQPIAGCNFWAWGGEGRPRTPKAVWKTGDEFIGDPPFEYQGWYSIYDKDESTLKIIKDYATKMSGL
ncbi:MAG: mannanase [Saprospiraceae bacterium]